MIHTITIKIREDRSMDTKESLIDFLIDHVPNTDNISDSDRRVQFDGYLSQLRHWD